MKRYAVCITDDDGGTGEAVFTVKKKNRGTGQRSPLYPSVATPQREDRVYPGVGRG